MHQNPQKLGLEIIEIFAQIWNFDGDDLFWLRHFLWASPNDYYTYYLRIVTVNILIL